MQIKLTSVFVDDQAKALKVLHRTFWLPNENGFLAGTYRWLQWSPRKIRRACNWFLRPTRATPGREDLSTGDFSQGIAAANFFVADVQKEYERLKQLGVTFTKEPTRLRIDHRGA